MAQVSKYPLREDIYKRIIEIFLKTLIKIKDKKEALQFIKEFLTPTEKVMLAKRLSVALLLKKGYNYREVGDILRVSQGTVASVNVFLKYGSRGYHRILDKIIKDEKMEEFWKKIAEVLLERIPDKGKGTAGWRYLREEIRKKKRRTF